jgi:hypothetical protein
VDRSASLVRGGAGASAELRRRGRGPLDVSTATELARVYPADANGYYAALGFSYGERPTRGEVARAYLARGGQDSVFLTQAAKTLLDPVLRADYDATPVGYPYLDALLCSWLVTLPGIWEVLGEPEEDASEPLYAVRENASVFTHHRADHGSFGWSYYQDVDLGVLDESRLARWQQVLVRVVDAPRFGIGVTAGKEAYCRLIDDLDVVFVPAGWLGNPAQSIDYPLHNLGLIMKYQGGKKAEDIVNSDTEFSGGFSNRNFTYVSKDLPNKDSHIYLHFLDDYEMPVDERNFTIALAVHPWAAVQKPKPNEADSWPEQLTPVCRAQRMLEGEHPDCYVCEYLTKEDKNGKDRPWPKVKMTFGRAVEMEVRKVTKADVDAGLASDDVVGKKASIPVFEEVVERDAKGEETGGTTARPKIYLVNMKENFWADVRACGDEYGTLLDRTYHVTRTGVKKDTDYTVVPSVEDKHDFAIDREIYDEVFSFEDMTNYIDGLHSDDYYAKFFDLRVASPLDKAEGTPRPDSTSAPTQTDGSAKSSPEPDPDRMASLKERLAAARQKSKTPAAVGAEE